MGVAGQSFEQHVLGGAVDDFDGAFEVGAVGRQDDQLGAEHFERLVHALAQEVTAAVGADLAGDAAEEPVTIRAEDGVAGGGQDGVLAGLVGVMASPQMTAVAWSMNHVIQGSRQRPSTLTKNGASARRLASYAGSVPANRRRVCRWRPGSVPP